eukprot:s9804_g2.t1
MLFRCADLSGSGALNFVEFMAAMMANLPEVYCSHSSLKAVFHFFDSGHGILQGEQLHLLFPARPEEECALMIRQSCGKDGTKSTPLSEHSQRSALSSSALLLLFSSAHFCRGLDELPGLPASDDARELEALRLRLLAREVGGRSRRDEPRAAAVRLLLGS